MEQQIQKLQTQTKDTLIAKVLEFHVANYMSKGPEGWLKFMKDELKYVPDKPIERAILDVAQFKDTTVRSSHGVGKTAMDACVLLTAMAMVPNLGSIQLAPTWRQVKDILWNEVRKWYKHSRILPVLFELADKAPRMESKLSPETWYARGISSTHQGNVEGEHNEHFFLIVDEAKAVEDAIIEGAQGALTSSGPNAKVWSLYTSTPSTPGGSHTLFYKSHTKHGRWKRHKITAQESPRVSKKWIQRMVEDWGIDSQIVQARVFAEFPEGGEDILIPLQAAEAFYDPNAESKGYVSLGIDVARFGQDETVISVWQGDTLIGLNAFEKKSTVQVTELAIEYIERYKARCIVIDDIGVGGGVTDQIAAKYENNDLIFVIPFIASARTTDVTKYVNAGDEIWWLFAKALKEGRLKSLIQDDVLEGELTSYRIAYSKDNRISIKWPERKQDRMGSDSRSPDRGDSCVMGWYGSTLIHGARSLLEPKDEVFEHSDFGHTLAGNLLKRSF